MSDFTEIQEGLLGLLNALPEQPRRLKLEVGQVTIELDWPGTGQERPAGPDPAPAANGDVAHVRSPGVGTFYRSLEPGAAPLVSEGDLIRPGQQVAIVEAMKLMLPVETAEAGRVARILKENGTPVEYGEPLIELTTPGDETGSG